MGYYFRSGRRKQEGETFFVISGVKNARNGIEREDVRVYDFDMIVEEKMTKSRAEAKAAAQKREAAMAKYIQPEEAAVPERLEAEKREALLEVHKQREKERLRIVKARGEKKQPIFGIMMTALIFTILFMFIMWTSAQINESTQAIGDLQTRLTQLTDREKELNFLMEKKNDLRVIEEMASLEYGMVKSDNLTKQHVNISNEDKIEVSEPEEVEESTFSTVMSAIGENFSNLMEYIY